VTAINLKFVEYLKNDSPDKKSQLNLLKGPKLEIFGSRVFTQIRPVWVGDLETRPKNSI
jgi:hypothetical protein